MNFSGFDAFLAALFMISYHVFALIQLNNLFRRRFILFVAFALVAALAAQGAALLDVERYCADATSAILCGGERRGLRALGMVWVYVSIATLGMYGLVQCIRFVKTTSR